MTNLFIIIGVSGSGKSTVAAKLADKLDYTYIDADDFHSDAAKEMMAAGEALTDELRSTWMEKLSRFLEPKALQQEAVVLAHSGLKLVHRDMLRMLGFRALFFYLQGSEDLIAQRIQNRAEHFFPVGLLRSQFLSLDDPKISQKQGKEMDVINVNIEQSLDAIMKEVELKALTFIQEGSAGQ